MLHRRPPCLPPRQPHQRAKKYKKDKHNLTKIEFRHIMKNLPVPVCGFTDTNLSN
jgi:hypothetical protein